MGKSMEEQQACGEVRLLAPLPLQSAPEAGGEKPVHLRVEGARTARCRRSSPARCAIRRWRERTPRYRRELRAQAGAGYSASAMASTAIWPTGARPKGTCRRKGAGSYDHVPAAGGATAEPAPVCVTATSDARYSRPMDNEDMCDDGRAGIDKKIEESDEEKIGP